MIGEDQAPHVELSRKIIRRFNSLYGPVFPEPQTILTETPRLKGTDGRKMSKNYNNYLAPNFSLEEYSAKIEKMITDPTKIKKNDPGHPGICSVYPLHELYNPEKKSVHDECSSGSRGCVDCKKDLSRILDKEFEPFREKRKYYESRENEVKEIIYEGSKKARKIACATLEEVTVSMKINF